MIKTFQNKKPKAGKGVFISQSSEVIGDVIIGEESSVWPGAVLRGDEGSIRIGKNSNIQDNCVIHGIRTIIKDNVSVGHGSLIHGSTINSNCIIGMGAILLNGSVIGENCIIGAGAVVTENKMIPSHNLAIGVPAKVVRQLTEEEIKGIKQNALHYLELKKLYRK